MNILILDVAIPTELLPLITPQAGEKGVDDPSRFYLDSLMEFMVTQVIRKLVEHLNSLPKQNFSIFPGNACRMERQTSWAPSTMLFISLAQISIMLPPSHLPGHF